MLARQRPILKKLPIAGSVRIPERVHAAPHVHYRRSRTAADRQRDSARRYAGRRIHRYHRECCWLRRPVVAGKLALGTWQGIYLVEHRRRPHRREVNFQFIGSRK
jgi:hypothetical protein